MDPVIFEKKIGKEKKIESEELNGIYPEKKTIVMWVTKHN